MPEIPTQEAEIGGAQVQGRPQQFREDLSQI